MAKSGKRRMGWRVLLILLLVFFVLPLVTLFIIRWRTTSAWEDFRTHWEAQGEKFKLEDHIPGPVPDDENLALHPRFADLHLPGSGADAWFDAIDVTRIAGYDAKSSTAQRELCRNADFAAWKSIPATATLEERLAEVSKRLAPLDAGLDEVAAALAERPHCRYAHDWNQTFMLSNPQVFEFMRLGKGFSTRATLRLATGDPEGATHDLEAVHRLATAAGDGATFISYLVEIGLHAMAINVLWDGLDRQVFRDADLQRLEASLAGIAPFPERILPCLRLERAMLLRFADQFERDPGSIAGSPGTTRLTGVRSVAVRMWMSASRLGASEDLQEAVLAPHGTLVTRPDWKSFGDWERRIEARWSGPRKYLETFAALATPALGKSGEKAYQVEALHHHARIAIALERHRLAHGAFPATLAGLVPPFLPAVPEDRINGRPIEYRLKPDGTPLVYQWGFDGDDDGGTSRKDPRHGDLVWQYSLDPGFTETDWRQKD